MSKEGHLSFYQKSKYPIVKELQAPFTSAAVTYVIEDACAMFGRPDQIRSENGPQYAGQHFRNFCRRWGIQHVTSSPHYAQSNGFSERQVRWIKSIIKKCIKTSESIASCQSDTNRCKTAITCSHPNAAKNYSLSPLAPV